MPLILARQKNDSPLKILKPQKAHMENTGLQLYYINVFITVLVVVYFIIKPHWFCSSKAGYNTT